MNDTTPHDLVVHGDIALPGGHFLRGGWMGITGGRIEQTSETPLVGRDTLHVSGNVVLPGFVDAHVHTRSTISVERCPSSRATVHGATGAPRSRVWRRADVQV